MRLSEGMSPSEAPVFATVTGGAGYLLVTSTRVRLNPPGGRRAAA